MIVNPGETVTLECEFYAADHEDFNLFDNPVLWRKAQVDEETQVNMMGNLVEPFASQKRFVVSFTPQPPKYRLMLVVTRKSVWTVYNL